MVSAHALYPVSETRVPVPPWAFPPCHLWLVSHVRTSRELFHLSKADLAEDNLSSILRLIHCSNWPFHVSVFTLAEIVASIFFWCCKSLSASENKQTLSTDGLI